MDSLLKKYTNVQNFEREGNSSIQRSNGNLGRWVGTQRREYNRGKLSQKRML